MPNPTDFSILKVNFHKVVSSDGLGAAGTFYKRLKPDPSATHRIKNY